MLGVWSWQAPPKTAPAVLNHRARVRAWRHSLGETARFLPPIKDRGETYASVLALAFCEDDSSVGVLQRAPSQNLMSFSRS